MAIHFAGFQKTAAELNKIIIVSQAADKGILYQTVNRLVFIGIGIGDRGPHINIRQSNYPITRIEKYQLKWTYFTI